MARRSNRGKSDAQRTLLCATGLSPQVVTETVYAIRQRDGRDLMPDRIVVVTTDMGKERICNDLLDPAGPCHLRALMKESGQRTGRSILAESDIHVIHDRQGQPLADIRTRDHNEAAADLIFRVVRELTEQPDSHLHASIAGGRKTMGFYLGHAMSLFARPNDEISHVLVNAPFEGHPEFYYPPIEPRMIRIQEGGRSHLMRTDKAQVTLASIPIVRLRASLPPELMDQALTYSEAVALAQRSLAPPKLVIDVENRVISCSGHVVRLPGAQLALLAWMADRVHRGAGGVPRVDMDEHRSELIEWRARVTGAHSGSTEAIEQSDFSKETFDSINSRLKGALEKHLGRELARHYQIGLQGGRRNQPMTLPLAPDQVEFAPILLQEESRS